MLIIKGCGAFIVFVGVCMLIGLFFMDSDYSAWEKIAMIIFFPIGVFLLFGIFYIMHKMSTWYEDPWK